MSPKTKGSKPLRGAAIMLALFLAVCASLGFAGGSRSVLTEAMAVRANVLGLMLALSVANYACRALRWHLMSSRLGLRTNLRESVLYFVAGLALTATPGKLGETIRLLLLRRRYGYSLVRLAPLALLDRLADLVALLLGSAIGFAALRTHPLAIAAVAVPGIVLTASLLCPAPVIALLNASFHLLRRSPRVFAGSRRAVRLGARVVSGHGALRLLLLSLLGWSAEAGSLYILAHAMGAALSLSSAISVFCLSMLVGGIMMTPGGIGTTEVAMVALLLDRGIALPTAVAMTAILRLTTLWFAVLGGIPFLAFAARRPPRIADSKLVAA